MTENKQYDLIPVLKAPAKIELRSSDVGGYGVFATRFIKENEVIEEAPYVKTSYRSKDLIHPELRQILYTFPCSCETCKYRGRNFVLSSGFVQMYNHAEKGKESVKFEWIYESRIIRVVAIRDIKANEEVFHYYGSNYSFFNEVK